VYRFLVLLNNLSLDVGLGAVVSMVFVSRLWGREARPEDLLLLFVAVWAIYILDRVLDVRKLKSWASTKRHRFAQRFKRPLLFLLAFLLVAGAGMAVWWRPATLAGGSVVVVFMVAYFLLVQKWHFFSRSGSKEVFIAVVYTAGIHLPLLYPNQLDLFGAGEPFTLVLYFILALANILLFSIADKGNDTADERVSVAHGISQKKLKTGVAFLMGVYFLLVLLLFFQGLQSRYAMVFFLQGAVLLGLCKWTAYFLKVGWFRILGDGIFIVPVIVFVF